MSLRQKRWQFEGKQLKKQSVPFIVLGLLVGACFWYLVLLSMTGVAAMTSSRLLRLACKLFLLGVTVLILRHINRPRLKYPRKPRTRVPYTDIGETQLNNTRPQYNAYYSYIGIHGHEMEERILFFLTARNIFLGI